MVFGSSRKRAGDIKESSAAVVVQKINICSDHKSVPYWGLKIAEGYDLRGIETAREREIKTAREACLRDNKVGSIGEDSARLFTKQMKSGRVCAILWSE